MNQNEVKIDHPSGIDIPGIVVVNVLPWTRTVSGRVSKDMLDPRGWYNDPTSTRHHQDREMDRPLTSAVFHIGEFFGFYNAFGAGENYYLPPTELPPFGFTIVPTRDLVPEREWSFDERSTVHTDRYKLTFDREQGGIKSWYDSELDCEWINQDSKYTLGGFVHERLSDADEERPRQLLYRTPSGDDVEDPLHPPTGWQPDWNAHRDSSTRVVRHRVYETPDSIDVVQTLSVPSIDGKVDLCFHVPNTGDEIIVEANWTMGQNQRPESTYLTFPFDIPDAEAYVDVGGQSMKPGNDQLPGSCFDYYTAQRWVEMANDRRGMTVGCPINPMFQFGDFHFGDKQNSFTLNSSLLLGWVTTNYWDTNFRAHQPGHVRARYHLKPHEGTFAESKAHKFGFEAEHWEPLVNSRNEESLDNASLPNFGSFLSLPSLPILTLQVKPDFESEIPFYPTEGGGNTHLWKSDEELSDTTFTVLLRNASDGPQTATIGSEILSVKTAELVSLLGEHLDDLSVKDGEVGIDLTPRENKRIRLDCSV